MPDRINRRTVLAALSAVAGSAGQVPAPAAEDPLQKAYAEVKETSAKLRQIDIPMNLEPAFTFHV
jgi:hypothetical protein